VDKRRRPELTLKRILELADAYHARTGDWPSAFSSWLPGDRELTWRRIDNALRYGLRGLSGRDSLAKLLARERGVRKVGDLPELTEENILLWAELHRERTRRWPNENSGPIADAPRRDLGQRQRRPDAGPSRFPRREQSGRPDRGVRSR
jgi:hypothetical protein